MGFTLTKPIFNLRFAKPVRVVDEGEMFKPSLIAISKKPEASKIGDGGRWVILSSRYYFYLNLWLVEIDFRFSLPSTEAILERIKERS